MRLMLLLLLHILSPNNRVDLVRTLPKPLLELQINDRRPAIYHSVMRITTAYGQYILDLTGDQYGFSGMLLLTLEYLRQFVADDNSVSQEFRYSNIPPMIKGWLRTDFRDGAGKGFWEHTEQSLSFLMMEWKDGLSDGQRREGGCCAASGLRCIASRIVAASRVVWV
ncbi:hypothetical protein BU23DRAFT_565841 [Bimuria novae-zelandiae CBS 107.79]|uniref:Uncharacterized protein n=1 Tax=Bimuria novae-zelandiae CBS 107.79 TaxID=1447943 RepID=A0A6A5VGG0_9PLEO|nr:hypothetical protein BU23DRAFT_565841 [Bimuria novae-zelandiae CBS 107.79]